MTIFIMLFLLLVTFLIYKKDSNYRFLLIIVNTIISLVYIIWRITVIPTSSGIFSFMLGITLYLAELLGLISLFCGVGAVLFNFCCKYVVTIINKTIIIYS